MPKIKFGKQRKVRINSARRITLESVGHSPGFLDSTLHNIVMGVMFGDSPDEIDGQKSFRNCLDDEIDEANDSDEAKFIQSAVVEIMAAHAKFIATRQRNLQRLTRDEQIEDLENLRNCLLEAHERLFPLYLPPDIKPLMREKYSPIEGGEDTFDDEVINLLKRIYNLIQVTENIDLLYRETTNPGKPELDDFLMSLDQIFRDTFATRLALLGNSYDEEERNYYENIKQKKKQFKDSFFAAIFEFYQMRLPKRYERNITQAKTRTTR